MDYRSIPEHVLRLYTTTGIAGYRISRMEESFLGLFRLTADIAWKLGTANVGVFVGGAPALGKTIERLRGLEGPDAATWVLVAATKKMAAVIAHRWFQAGLGSWVAPTTLLLPRYQMNIVLCTPESLRRVRPTNGVPSPRSSSSICYATSIKRGALKGVTSTSRTIAPSLSRASGIRSCVMVGHHPSSS